MNSVFNRQLEMAANTTAVANITRLDEFQAVEEITR